MGVPRATLHGWKKRYMIKEDPDALNPLPENWSAEEKFAAVVHTATLSEVELNTWCRENGLYPGHIKSWREACIRGNNPPSKHAHRTSAYREDKRKVQILERELQRKEKALAELAALLVRFRVTLPNRQTVVAEPISDVNIWRFCSKLAWSLCE